MARADYCSASSATVDQRQIETLIGVWGTLSPTFGGWRPVQLDCYPLVPSRSAYVLRLHRSPSAQSG